MFDVLPEVLSRARRGICPTCGAPLQLEGAGFAAKCDFCGTESNLEQRLRAVEPDLGDAPKKERAPYLPPKRKPSADAKGRTRWIALHGKREQCNCPGCGSAFDVNAAQAIQQCPYCGTESKLEARLRPIGTQDVPEPQERTYADSRLGNTTDYPWDVRVEQLIWRIRTEPDLEQRIALATSCSKWVLINATMAHFLPWLLDAVLRDDDAVTLAGCDAVGKLLCNDDDSLILPVLQACDRIVLEPFMKPILLHEIALGPAICAKLLLDAAEAAYQHGNRELCFNALWGVNTLVGRHFPAHPHLAEVFLYRMYYLSGPVLGWAMYYLEAGFHGGYRHDWRKLLAHIDAFAIERPEVVPALRRSLRAKKIESDELFNEYLDGLEGAQTAAGRSAAADLLDAHESVTAASYARAVELLVPMLDDPAAQIAAVLALRRIMQAKPGVPEAVHALVARRGEALPDAFKYDYIKLVKETPHLDTSRKYEWLKPPKLELEPEAQALLDEWKAGIRDVVATYRAWVKQTRERIKAVGKLDPPLYLRDGPPTLLPPGPEVLETPAEMPGLDAPTQAEDMVARVGDLQRAFGEQATALSQRMADPATTPAQRQQMMKELADLSARLQDDVRKATGA